MTLYTYKITEYNDRADVLILVGDIEVARSIVFRGNLDFEAYSVINIFKGKGLSYALTYIMLLYCQDNNISSRPTVWNAKTILMETLPKSGFLLEGQVRITKNRQDRAGSYRCSNMKNSLEMIKKILITKGIIKDGLRFSGPYQWKS